MNSSSSLRVEGDQNYTSSQQSPTPKTAILNLLRIVAGDTSLASNFSQVWVVREFQLGDDLTSYSLNRPSEENRNVLYLVCRGRVRLLGFDTTHRNLVSTQLLSAEQTFGADHLFCDQLLPYQAIAASAGFVASIPLDTLKPWLQRIPNLQDYFQRQAWERQALIFFKTGTELRSITSHSLRKFLPYLVETKIPAGSSLPQATPPSQGRYWLVGGKIHSASAEMPPLVGESWGYPDVTLPAWNAQTDLSVYHLPKEYWESASAVTPLSFINRWDQVVVPEVASHNNLPIPETLTAVPDLIELSPRKPQPESASEPKTNADIEFQQLQGRPSVAWLWRRIPFIQQQSASDCGAACLAMISQYWGKRLSLNTLRNLARVDRIGASLDGIATAAQTLGYQALPVRASLSKVEWQTNPWIAHWQGNHYVVVWQIKGDRVLICDPAVGKRSVTRQEFEVSWTGYALLLEPTERFSAIKSEKLDSNNFWQGFWDYRNLIIQIAVAGVLLQVFGLATPLFTQVVLDRVLPEKSFATLNLFAGGFLLFGIWRIASKGVRQYLLDYLSNRMEIALLGRFINHLLRLPLEFFRLRHVGDIITRVQENRKIQQFLTRQAFCATLDALFALVYLGVMAYYNIQLTLVVVGLIVCMGIFTLATSPLLRRVSREIFLSSAEQNSSMVEMITGVATVKSAAVEKQLRWRWEERFTKMVKARFRGQKLANNLQVATSLINHLGSTVVLWYGATLVMDGSLSVGKFVAFNMLIGSALAPILALVNLWEEFQEVLISQERLNDVLTQQPEENPQKPLLVLPPIRGDVHFENVTFGFHPDEHRNTLQNISFKVKGGQTIGIVGKSGSGKSTLVNLLAGLYRPNNGRILIDGHDISNVSSRSLRSQLGVVPQDCFLFSGTILDNITLYSSEFTLESAIKAAKLAQAHGFIEALPMGYNTFVGERGMMLSGGQRQRIAIARALLRNPRILILDEATSSLDAESERLLQQNFARFSRHAAFGKPRTTFIIAHRLSTLSHADCILVLDRGILVEQGTHQQLMTIRGFYYHLAQQQLHL